MDVEMSQEPQIDLGAYIAQYRDHAKTHRLLHIAMTTTSEALRAQALREAERELKTGLPFLDRYKRVCQLAQQFNVPDVQLDEHWLQQKEEEAAGQLRILSENLECAVSNKIREHIRQQTMEMGDYHYNRGDFNLAAKYFLRARDVCANAKQHTNFCLALIRTYIHANSWSMVSTFVQRGESYLEPRGHDAGGAGTGVLKAQLAAAAGLSELSMTRFSSAAQRFAEVGAELGSTFNDAVSSVDVARYGALTALAALDRKDIKRQLLLSQTFGAHLDGLTEVRDLLEAMCTSRYADAFAILDGMQPLLVLDPYLANLPGILQRIRSRVLLEFTQPFQSLRLPAMAEALGCAVGSLEMELAQLVASGKLAARIDSHKQVLYRRRQDERRGAIEAALKTADDFISNTHGMLLHVELLKAGLKHTTVAPPVDPMWGGLMGGVSSHILTD